MKLDYIPQAIDYIIDFTLTHLKQLVILAGVILLAVVGFNLFSQYGLVWVEVPASKSTTNIYATTTLETKNLGGPGLKILPRQTKTIMASEGDYIKSQKAVQFPWYGYASVKISLHSDKNATKVAYANTFSTACSTYTAEIDTLLSYNCTEPTTLSYIDPKDGSRKVTSPFSFIGNRAQPYRGGVMGLMRSTAENANGAVAYVSHTGVQSSYNIPTELNRSGIENLKVFTNTFDTSDPRFGLITTSGVVYLGTPSTEQKNTASYTRFNPPKEYIQDEQQTECSFKTDIVYCYRGRYAVGDMHSSGKPIRATITKMSFTNPDAIVNDIEDEQQGFLDGFSATPDGTLYGKYYKTLVSYSLNKDVYQNKIIAQNVDSMATGDQLYYVQTGGLFRHTKNTGQSSQVFYSNNAVVRAVYPTKDKTFVYGSIRNGGGTIHAYSLSDDDDTTPGKRLIDLLPTANGKLSGVVSQTFYGNKLVLTVTGSTFKNQAGVTTFNERAFDAVRSSTLNELSNLGIDTNTLDITFKY